MICPSSLLLLRKHHDVKSGLLMDMSLTIVLKAKWRGVGQNIKRPSFKA